MRGCLAVLSSRWPVRLVLAPGVSDREIEVGFVEGRVASIVVPEMAFGIVGGGLARAVMAGQDHVEITRLRAEDGRVINQRRAARKSTVRATSGDAQ